MQDNDHGGSPACFAHELIGGHAVDAATKRDVDRFRAAERQRLYALRKAMPQPDRAAQTACVINLLTQWGGDLSDANVAVYWPIRGELDLRPWMTALHESGARIALPVVVQKQQPVAFHHWWPGCDMARGIWTIPVPARAQPLVPDVVVIPLVGVDTACFRLGNGGGYYDMTLAALPEMPRTVAVGQDFCLMPTIFPQPWDVQIGTVLLGDGQVISPEIHPKRPCDGGAV